MLVAYRHGLRASEVVQAALGQLDLLPLQVAELDCQVYDAWGAFLDVDFMRINHACASPTV